MKKMTFTADIADYVQLADYDLERFADACNDMAVIKLNELDLDKRLFDITTSYSLNAECEPITEFTEEEFLDLFEGDLVENSNNAILFAKLPLKYLQNKNFTVCSLIDNIVHIGYKEAKKYYIINNNLNSQNDL